MTSQTHRIAVEFTSSSWDIEVTNSNPNVLHSMTHTFLGWTRVGLNTCPICCRIDTVFADQQGNWRCKRCIRIARAQGDRVRTQKAKRVAKLSHTV